MVAARLRKSEDEGKHETHYSSPDAINRKVTNRSLTYSLCPRAAHEAHVSVADEGKVDQNDDIRAQDNHAVRCEAVGGKPEDDSGER